MPSVIVHYAVGVGIAHALGYRGRGAWLLGAFAAAPDLDVVTAVLNFGIFSLTTPPPAVTEFLSLWFGHRAMSHSLLVTGLVGLGALAYARRWRYAGAVTLVYASHLLMDALTTWPLFPLLPTTRGSLEFGFITIWDPVVTALSVAYLVFALAAERREGSLDWPRRPWRWIERATAERWWRRAKVTALAFLMLFPAIAAAKAGIAAATGSRFVDVEPVHLFQYSYVVRHGDNYTVGLTPFPGSPAQTLTVPVVSFARNATREDVALMFDAATRLDCLGHYNWYRNPLWTVAVEGDVAEVEVRTARAAATGSGEGGFALRFTYVGRELERVGLLTGTGNDARSVTELTTLARGCG